MTEATVNPAILEQAENYHEPPADRTLFISEDFDPEDAIIDAMIDISEDDLFNMEDDA